VINRKRKLIAATGQQKRKARLRELLEARDFETLQKWTAEDHYVLRGLTGLLFDRNNYRCWQAVEGLGYATEVQATKDLEKIRRLLRSQFWNMNDESGNVGWFSAEAIGEMLHGAPVLIDEFAGMIPHFFKEEPFERGAHWAVARVAQLRPDFYKSSMPTISQSLNEEDPYIRMYTIWALAAIGPMFVKGTIRELIDDSTECEYYDFETGQMVATTVGAEARKALGE